MDDLARLATCQCSTPAMVTSNANSLVADENTRDWLVWLIKGLWLHLEQSSERMIL